MAKIIKTFLKIVAGLVVFVLVLLGGTSLALNTKSVQNKILKYSTQLLRDKLQSRVEVDSVDINFFTLDVNMYGVYIEDQSQRKLLQTQQISVKVEPLPLLKNEVKVSKILLKGVDAGLVKDSIEGANYQFIIDAFKNKNPKPKKVVKNDSIKKQKLVFDVDELVFSDLKATYNDSKFLISELQCYKKFTGKRKVILRHAEAKWNSVTKKGPMSNEASVNTIIYNEKGDERYVDITDLRYSNDNHKPRKNVGKKNRGFFDVGHFDLVAMMKITIHNVDKDTVDATVTRCTVTDDESGIDLRDIRFDVSANKRLANLSKITIQQGANTVLNIDKAVLNFPSKKENRKLSYGTSTIKGTTQLRDISRVFAPVLKDFTIPLYLQTKLSGTDEGLVFKDIYVHNSDKSLQIRAQGGITNLKDKYKLDVFFNVNKLTAKVSEVQKIINLFPLKKKFMMKQLNSLGSITYLGNMHVIYKKEKFHGTLGTTAGNIGVDLLIDNNTKYVTGDIQTSNFRLGKVMDMPGLGDISCKANFVIDISKQRTAEVRKKVGGKLPIGNVKAFINTASYKGVSVNDVEGEIKSNGAIAEGNVIQRHRYADVVCNFSFTNTDDMKKTKIKPGVKFHKDSDKGKSKEERAAEKAAEKKAKAERKAAKKVEKEKRKAEKAAQKEQNAKNGKKKKGLLGLW